MRSKRLEETTELFKAVRAYNSQNESSSSKINVQHERLLPELRPYQVNAVRWMLQRERQEQTNLFLNFEGAASSSECSDGIELTLMPKGGILADEMGLGKTVEVIACILNNPRPESDMDNGKSIINDSDLSIQEVKEETQEESEKDVSDIKECEIVEISSNQNSLNEEETKKCSEEVLTSHKKRKSQDNKKKGQKKQKTEEGQNKGPKKSQLKQLCQAWYEQKLLEGNVNMRRVSEWELNEQKIHCLCGSQEEKKLVKCSECKHLLHASCIGVEEKAEERTWPVLCPQCWRQRDPLPSGTTLIITPSSIMRQWVSEISQHVAKPGLKVLVYQGVRQQGYLQPHKLRNYDVVITTYDVLRSELVYDEGGHERTMRYAKRFYSPTCPLLSVQWWRVCLDEAQMVEGTTTKAAEMAIKLVAVNRWAVTGTPVQKSLHDLYGLVLFVGVEPFSVSKVWDSEIYLPYQRGIRNPMHTLISSIMWRSSKADVEDQIKLPPQSEEIHWLNFSPVEEHFYRRTHGECAADFNERLSKCKEDPDTALRSLRLTTVNYILAPLLRLRQACSHPQAVRGSSLTAKKGTMTMHELLESLIKKTCAEAEDSLREYIAALNGMAAMHIICNEWAAAVEKYRDVLRISEEYKSKLKVDSLQRIHTMHNLSEILEAQPMKFDQTLRDSSLREEARELEVKYMKKCEANVEAAKKMASTHGAASLTLESELAERDEDSWWVDIVHHLVEQGVEDDLIHRVHNTLLDNRKSVPELSSTSIINRVSTFQGIKRELLFWVENLEDSRKKSTKSLRELQVTDTSELVNQAVDCHLRVTAQKSGKKNCALCACEGFLKKYEIRLFDVKNKRQENEMIGDVLLLGQTKQGSWMPSEPERVLRVVVSMGKNKKATVDAIETGNTFLKLMDALRKEFKSLRLLWSRLNDYVAAQDELNMCKLRLRLRFPDEAVPANAATVNKPNRRKKQMESQLSSNLNVRTETIHIIEPHEVESRILRLQSEVLVSQSELRKKSGTLVYLKNLQEKDDLNSNPEPCPICQTALGDKWCVLQCGHCYCMDCMSELVKNNASPTALSLQCAVCRERTPFSDISCVNLNSQNSVEKEETPVRGSHSTKVEAVVRRVLQLRSEDEAVKILIFTTWDRVLNVLECALSDNSVLYCRLEGGLKNHLALQKFKDVDKENQFTVLLLPLAMGAKGLNLTEATHVFLVEPILNPAEELQAVGRVHRIGQTKPTTVHRFLIKGTIEERMFSAMRTTGAEQWSGDCVTIRQLKDLFTVPSTKINECKDRQTEVVDLDDDNTTGSIVACASSSQTSNPSTGIPMETETVTQPERTDSVSAIKTEIPEDSDSTNALETGVASSNSGPESAMSCDPETVDSINEENE